MGGPVMERRRKSARRRTRSVDYRVYRRLSRLPRSTKRTLMVAADSLILPFALYSAYVLRLGTFTPVELASAWWLLPLAPLIGIPVLGRIGLYRAVVRFMGAQAVGVVLKGVTQLTLLLAIPALFLASPRIPLATLVVFWLASLLYIGGSRFLVRSYFHRPRQPAERVIIYGAGAAGARVAAAFTRGAAAPVSLCLAL